MCPRRPFQSSESAPLLHIGWSISRTQSAPLIVRRCEECEFAMLQSYRIDRLQTAPLEKHNNSHLDTVVTGGPPNPLISATRPTRTCCISVASTAWNTVLRAWRTSRMLALISLLCEMLATKFRLHSALPVCAKNWRGLWHDSAPMLVEPSASFGSRCSSRSLSKLIWHPVTRV